MDNQNILTSFFEAENKRDWEAYRKFLHPNVKWILHSKEVKTIEGIEEYLNTMKAAYKDCEDTFICEKTYQDAASSRIVAILLNNHGDRSCDIFDFKDGLIFKEYEFILE